MWCVAVLCGAWLHGRGCCAAPYLVQLRGPLVHVRTELPNAGLHAGLDARVAAGHLWQTEGRWGERLVAMSAPRNACRWSASLRAAIRVGVTCAAATEEGSRLCTVSWYVGAAAELCVWCVLLLEGRRGWATVTPQPHTGSGGVPVLCRGCATILLLTPKCT